MSTEYWKANKDIHDQVMVLVGQNHPDLALCVEEIVVVFRSKAGKSGGQVILGRPKKATALANALAGEDYKFVLEVGADVWETGLTAREREALLDHLLCACRAEDDPKSGEIKYSIAPPELSAYRDNIARYGLWFPREDDEEEDSAVEKMFGASE
jgi:hypothetical protein